MLLQNFVIAHSAQNPSMKFENTGYSGNTISMSTLLSENLQRCGDPCSSRYSNGQGVHWAIFVGKGDTAPTFTDYALADKATELTWLSGSMAVNIGTVMWSLTSVFKNETNANVIIKEIAFGWYGNYSTNGYGILLARRVLTTPVTIAPGETYSFTYNIEVGS